MTNTPHKSPSLLYQIRLQGHLDDGWDDWFGGVTITLDDDGSTRLTCEISDQASLHAILRQVRDLGLPLLSINRIEPGQS